MTSSLIHSGRPPARASRAVRTASSAVSQPEVFGRSSTSSGTNVVMSSPGASKSIRRTATVTISAPEATTASRILAKLSYFPVPRIRRDPKLRPAIVSVSCTRPKLAVSALALAPCEPRVALLDEGGHAFLLILGGEHHREEARLELQIC